MKFLRSEKGGRKKGAEERRAADGETPYESTSLHPRRRFRPETFAREVTRENRRGRNLSADARHTGREKREKKKEREDSSRTRGDRRTRGRERGTREERKGKKNRRRGTYESHVVRSSRSSLAPAATAGTAPRTFGTRFSRGRKHDAAESSSDATRARRRFEVIYREGCESE